MEKEYLLKNEIIVGEETLKSLIFEEPTLSRMEMHDVDLSEKALSSAGGMKRLLCACCTNATELHLSKLKSSDLTGAMEICQLFFG